MLAFILKICKPIMVEYRKMDIVSCISFVYVIMLGCMKGLTSKRNHNFIVSEIYLKFNFVTFSMYVFDHPS